jgi:hypothetical protein
VHNRSAIILSFTYQYHGFGALLFLFWQIVLLVIIVCVEQHDGILGFDIYAVQC